MTKASGAGWREQQHYSVCQLSLCPPGLKGLSWSVCSTKTPFGNAQSETRPRPRLAMHSQKQHQDPVWQCTVRNSTKTPFGNVQSETRPRPRLAMHNQKHDQDLVWQCTFRNSTKTPFGKCTVRNSTKHNKVKNNQKQHEDTYRL